MRAKVASLLEENNIDMSDEMEKNQVQKHDQSDLIKANSIAKDHYDAEDLILFHELRLAKPLVKACSDLDFDHPTILQR